MAAKTAETRYVLHKKIDESPETLRLIFRPVSERLADFSPGMFVMILGYDGKGNKYGGRAFSIASDPGSNELELLAIKQPTHGGSTHETHFLTAKEGDEFVVTGPIGKFTVELGGGQKIAVFAGGTGLAPFASLLRKEARVQSGTDISMVYSVRRPQEVLLKNEIEALQKKIRLKTVVTVTRPEGGDIWAGRTGHIDSKMILDSMPDIGERVCYICGSLGFSKAVKAELMKLGVNERDIKIDAWG